MERKEEYIQFMLSFETDFWAIVVYLKDDLDGFVHFEHSVPTKISYVIEFQIMINNKPITEVISFSRFVFKINQEKKF